MFSLWKARPKGKQNIQKKKKNYNIYITAWRSSHFCYPIYLYEPGDMTLGRPPLAHATFCSHV